MTREQVRTLCYAASRLLDTAIARKKITQIQSFAEMAEVLAKKGVEL